MKQNRKTESVQDFLQIKDIRRGIVETADGRFLKILELEPIRFLLCSAGEQETILSAFAAWLKISPVRLQMKCLTEKAAPDRFLNALERDLEQQRNAGCARVGRSYIDLVRDLGTREALTHRFFLIFAYEPPRRSETGSFEQAYAFLQSAEQTARAYFRQCGNPVLQPEDPDAATAEFLYRFFNRRSAREEPFSERLCRIVRDTMEANGLCADGDPVPPVPMGSLIGPRGIDLTHPSYTVMDGRYYTVLYIRGDGYPGQVCAGWLSVLTNAGEGIDADIFLQRENRFKTVDRVARHIRLNRTRLKGTQDTGTDYESLTDSIRAGYYIKQAMANRDELFYLSVLITVSADRYEDLLWRKKQLVSLLRSVDIEVSDCGFQQEAALKSVTPFLSLDSSLERRARRNVLSGGAAAAYPFFGHEQTDEGGVLLGINQFDSSLCIVDLFNAKKHKNANLNLIGTSGAGKTFTLQLLALRMRMRGIRCFLIAPIKGHEFRNACEAIGGSYIRFAPGSPHCVNIMEIRPTVCGEPAPQEEDSLLIRKVRQLMTFFSLLIPDLSPEEEQLLDESLMETYLDFGITPENDSLSGPNGIKPMPILGDVQKRLCEKPAAGRIAAVLNRLINGSARSFNRRTNVDLTNPYTVLDLSELNGDMISAGMLLALDFVWDAVRADLHEKKAVLIDEIWRLIGASSNRLAAEFCLTVFKTIRGFKGAAIAATQDLYDFFSLDDGKYGRAIINNSQSKMILNLEPDEAKYVRSALNLTKAEVQTVTKLDRGEALVCLGSDRIPVAIRASAEEERLIASVPGNPELK